MAPPLIRSWMSAHRVAYGDLPVRDLCLPYSHDAGTYHRAFGTGFGIEANVLTQTKSIFEQLDLGVRVFDIRPVLAAPQGQEHDPTWNCGHYTGEAASKVGWQGASCASIQEVVDDLNRFTKDNHELVVVKVTSVYRIVIEGLIGSYQTHVDAEAWQNLLKLLTGVNDLFNLERAGGNKDKAIQDYKLDDFIRADRAAVVVIVDHGNRDELYSQGLWPTQTTGGQDTFSVDNIKWITREQAADEAIISTLSALFGGDVSGPSALNIAETVQQEQFPKLLQDMADGGLPGWIAMDRIENVDLLTFCLAVSYQRFNNAKDISDKNKVIVYGGQLIVDPGVHEDVQNAINERRSFLVNNDTLRAEPWLGMIKSCAIYYKQDGQLKGRWARERGWIQF